MRSHSFKIVKSMLKLMYGLYFSNFDVQVRATMRATGADEEEEEVTEEVLPDLLEVQTVLNYHTNFAISMQTFAF